ncbi:protein adenylyltransferase SelO [Mycolicibacterium boenickei]
MSVAPDTTGPSHGGLDNRFARALPEMAVAWQAEAAPAPRLLVLNETLAAELGLDPSWLRSPEGLGLLLGTTVPAGATPVAQAYAGHQFGGYVPRLGDGRALLLGEFVGAGDRLRDLHLKGSGRTPFARGGDGLAVVGPMLREYIVSESMHAMGIPTTRSLAVVATGRDVRRETLLPGAVLARIAGSHLRVGSFQYAGAHAEVAGDIGLLRRLADHAIERHHPSAADAENPYLAFYEAVVTAQATLVAQWMLVGFVHGVMNTDNMTISGETIDYGPCAFMETFDPAAVFSSIDHGGRYAYGNQPMVAAWNLARFAETLLPLLAENGDDAVELATGALHSFGPQFDAAWTAGMRAKLGLRADIADATAKTLTDDLLTLLQQGRHDYTSSWRALARAARGTEAEMLGQPGFDEWLPRWLALNPDPDAMDRVNPVYIPRNHLVEEALQGAGDGDLAPFEHLMRALAAPYDERPGLERYAAPAPDDFGPYRTFCGT